MGQIFEFSSAALFAAQAYFVATAAVAGALAGCFHWSVKLWGAEAKVGVSRIVGVAVVAGGGLIGSAFLAQGIVQRGEGDTTAYQLFGVISAAGAILVALGLLGALQATLGAARHAEDDPPVDPYDGLTLEWLMPSPAVGGVAPVDLAVVTSPYPLLDLREADGGPAGAGDEKESK